MFLAHLKVSILNLLDKAYTLTRSAFFLRFDAREYLTQVLKCDRRCLDRRLPTMDRLEATLEDREMNVRIVLLLAKTERARVRTNEYTDADLSTYARGFLK